MPDKPPFSLRYPVLSPGARPQTIARVILSSIGVLVLLLVIAVAAYYFTLPDGVRARYETLVQRQLPAGTTSSTVIAFLDSNHISHSPITRNKIGDEEVPGPFLALAASIQGRHAGKECFTGGLYLLFRFDTLGHLTSYRLTCAFSLP